MQEFNFIELFLFNFLSLCLAFYLNILFLICNKKGRHKRPFHTVKSVMTFTVNNSQRI